MYYYIFLRESETSSSRFGRRTDVKNYFANKKEAIKAVADVYGIKVKTTIKRFDDAEFHGNYKCLLHISVDEDTAAGDDVWGYLIKCKGKQE